MRPAALCLILAVSLAACSDEQPLKSPPTVAASPDLDLPARDVVYLAAEARDPDGEVRAVSWTLVSAPDSSQTALVGKGLRGEVLELWTGAVPGLYVLGVTATDDDGLESEPDFVNVTLRTPAALDLELVCVEGCEQLSAGLRAEELSAVQLEARRGGAPAAVAWEIVLVRDALDPLYEEPAVGARPSTAQIDVPRVARPAQLLVGAEAADGSSAQVALEVLNSVDEPPVVTLEWSRPASGPLPPGAEAQAVVLPGDALWVTAVTSDPNGDEVECSFPLFNSMPAERRDGADPCRITVYPLDDGTLEVAAEATTLEPVARVEAAPLRITVSPFRLEQDGPSLTAASIDAQGRVLAVGEAATFHVYRDGQRDTYATGLSEGSAAAISSGAAPQVGFLGWSSTGSWSRFDFDAGEQLTNLGWGFSSDPPTRTWAMAAGDSGMVYAATDRGIAFWDGGGSLQHWLPEGGLDARAIAVGPDGLWYDGPMGFIWYAAGNRVYCEMGNDPQFWNEPTEIGIVPGPEITALATGPEGIWDLWVGSAETGASAVGSGLRLYRDSISLETGMPELGEAESFFELDGPIRAIAVEQHGDYAGDAWAVLGATDSHPNRLVRVSRATLNGEDGSRVAVALELIANLGNAQPRGVAVTGAGERRVVVASDLGLVSGP